jgi:hypothetical protein
VKRERERERESGFRVYLGYALYICGYLLLGCSCCQAGLLGMNNKRPENTGILLSNTERQKKCLEFFVFQ